MMLGSLKLDLVKRKDERNTLFMEAYGLRCTSLSPCLEVPMVGYVPRFRRRHAGPHFAPAAPATESVAGLPWYERWAVRLLLLVPVICGPMIFARVWNGVAAIWNGIVGALGSTSELVTFQTDENFDLMFAVWAIYLGLFCVIGYFAIQVFGGRHAPDRDRGRWWWNTITKPWLWRAIVTGALYYTVGLAFVLFLNWAWPSWAVTGDHWIARAAPYFWYGAAKIYLAGEYVIRFFTALVHQR